MRAILEEALNHTVEIRSQAGQYDYRDDGKLIAFDSQWIKIEKPNGEILFFPIANIRLLKILS